MSDTETTVPQDGGAPASEPIITGSTEAPPPVETETTTEATPEQEAEEQPRQRRGDRRLAVLAAQSRAAQEQLARQSAELEDLRRRVGSAQPEQPQIPQEWQPILDREVEARIAARAQQQAREAFHDAGKQMAPQEWATICKDLEDMGADAPLSWVLVEMGREGAKAAVALHENPEDLERIAALKTPTARAIALGKYAATLEATPAPPRRAAQVSRAPAPIRPVNGSVNPEPNPYTMGPQEAVAWAEKQEAERRRLR
jgi:hypothetical protein